jgi:predicted NAD/FAD-binding protein
MKIAVVGAGVAGLSCAYRLARAGRDVTLFEGGGWFGGHAHSVDVTLDGCEHAVDTGFLVFNHATYPQLTALLNELDVATAASEMSFSVKLGHGGATLEWAGANLDTVFAQRRNLLRPRFLGMLADIVRFNRELTALAAGAPPQQSLGDFLARGRYGAAFRDWYLLPMAACIWSCPPAQMLAFPLATFAAFCHNHGLLQLRDRPQWRTVRGGARQYVRRLLEGIPQRHLNTPVLSIRRRSPALSAPVALRTAHGTQYFDQLVLACHSDEALALLDDASEAERAVLGAVRYQPNRAVLHTDSSCLPRRRKAWSAWNYQGGSDARGASRVCVHYLLNMLQPLPFSTPVIVSLNPVSALDPAKVLGQYDYAHPQLDAAAIAAQAALPQLQGVRATWFAGAWTGYGFHEDGLRSGLAVADALALAPVARAGAEAHRAA